MIAMSLSEFFTALKDGAWHTVDELADNLELPSSKLLKLSKLLSEQGLLRYENKTSKVKLEPIWKLFLPDEKQQNEPKTTLATFIIPPETSINIQSTHISNLSNIELEVGLRIKDKIKEVAIKV